MLTMLIVSFLILLAIGVPIAFCMGLSSTLAIISNGTVPWIVVPQRIFVAIDSFPMMAIPLFILAGELMNNGGITRRIVKFAGTLVGHIRGGLAHVTIVASMFLSGVSGSGSADCSAVGSMLIPAMSEEGYDKDFSVAVTASASTIGPIIPPSIMMIIYGSMTGISIGALFLAGFIPGVLIGLSLMVTAYFISVKRGYKAQARAGLKDIWEAFKRAAVAIIMPVIIMGGILSGIFTATEAGVVAVVYGFIAGFILKELRIKDIKRIFVESGIITATTMLVIASAQIMGWILAREMFPKIVVDALLSISDNRNIILLLVMLVLFILGFFMDGCAALIILVPVLAPIATSFNFDPIHFALIVLMILLVGAVTPPVGVYLFISCGIAKIRLSEGSKMIWPFVAAMIIVILICAFIPQLITFVPNVIL